MLPAVSVALCLAMLGVAGEEEEKKCAGRVGFFPHLEQCDKYYACRVNMVRNNTSQEVIHHFVLSFQATCVRMSWFTTAHISRPHFRYFCQ